MLWEDQKKDDHSLLRELVSARLRVKGFRGFHLDLDVNTDVLKSSQPIAAFSTNPHVLTSVDGDNYESWRQFVDEEIALPLAKSIDRFIIAALIGRHPHGMTTAIHVVAVPDDGNALGEVLNKVEIAAGPILFLVNPNAHACTAMPDAVCRRIDGLVGQVILTDALPLNDLILVERPDIRISAVIRLTTADSAPSSSVHLLVESIQSGNVTLATTYPCQWS